MWIKYLWQPFGCSVALHKMTAEDDPDCYHSHPAWAIRIILRGGYVEEMPGGACRRWRPGMVGIVRPSLFHRIHWIPDGVSYSLWLRGPRITEVRRAGDGWRDIDYEGRN